MVSSARLIETVTSERAALERRRRASRFEPVWRALDDVADPEIPVLSLWDLGVLQDVFADGTELVVVITPTYTGCPALDVMAADILARLADTELPPGIESVRLETRLAPAWTTDWLTRTARTRLREFGIAPPRRATGLPIACPQCGSTATETVSEFGSTACKALMRCTDCLEPFDYFKVH